MLSRLREYGRSALGIAMLAYSAARLGGRLILNTGKRITNPMTTPTTTPELDEAITGAFGVAIKIKQSLAEGSAGGKQVTIDEMLDTVTDEPMKESIRNLIEAIDRIVQGEPVNIFDLIPVAVDAVLDFLGTLRDALADKRITPDEILTGLTENGHLRPDLQKAIDGAEKIPAELQNLDMWKMIALVQKIAAYLPQLLAK